MPLLQTLQTLLETALLHLAATVSHFEAETLHIPPSLRFFTADADPDHLFRQAFMFALAPVHAFFTLPLMEKVMGGRRSGSWLWRCGGWYLQFLGMFGVAIVTVSALCYVAMKMALTEVEP